MKNKLTEDIGEEIISKLKELMAVIKNSTPVKKNEKKYVSSNKNRN